MVRWPPGLHPQTAKRRTSKLAWQPGWRDTGMQPIERIPVEQYTGRISGIPLTGGQTQGTIPMSGSLTLTIGPQGIGTFWYPIQVTLSTSTGQADTSTANVYLGPLITPATLVGTGPGNGSYALAIPVMTPGQYLVIQWAGGTASDTAAANVIGVMDAWTTPRG
jgi:hypothetical protein